jgi:DNA repair exonuclease SbcCD ATPase subunit
MPTYPEGTYEWALARIEELKSESAALISRLLVLEESTTSQDAREELAQLEAELDNIADEIEELDDQLGSLPHGEPSYSREELEEAGQMVLDVEP